MRGQGIIRVLLFIFFVAIGAAALGVSILCDDLLQYYKNKQLLKGTEESLNRLESLNADYDAVLEQLQKDPNIFNRIASATLGAEHEGQDTAYPRATAEQLAIARKVLAEDTKSETAEQMVPNWLVRCSSRRRRATLFLAGTFLILISFICFGKAKQTAKK